MALTTITLFKGATKKVPVKDITLNDALQAISTGVIEGQNYISTIEKIRSLGEKDERNKIKIKLHGFTFSGSFAYGSDEKIKDYSQIICHDFDKLGVDKVNDYKAKISSSQYVYACFISPSGDGLKILFKVASDRTKHKQAFTAIGNYLKQGYGISYDLANSNISRLCFLSYDPDIYINPDADVVPESLLSEYSPVEVKKPINKNIPYTGPVTDKLTDVEHCISQIEARKIDIAPIYEDWCKVGFALADEFGETGRDLFHRVSCYYPGYDYQAADTQYTKCLNGKGAGKVKIATFFGLCKRSGIDTKTPKKTPEKHPKNSIKTSQKSHETQQKQGFDENNGVGSEESKPGIGIEDLYRVNRHSDGRFKDINIIQHKFNNLLFSFGFRRYDIDLNSWIFVRLEKNIIQRVSITTIQDSFFRYLKSLPEKLNDEISREILIEKFTKGRETYFSHGNLSLLRNDKDFELCADTKEASFIFFRNGFIKCTAGSIELLPYEKLEGYIWKGQMIDKDFVKQELKETPIEESGMFARFIYNVCERDTKRMKALSSIIGYSLHTYYESKLKAMIFTDSEISNSPNGRTGKTLLLQSLKHIKPTVLINGKDFKTDHQFKYQDVELDTQIVALNDIKTSLKVEDLFNDITEGIRVEKKNQKPFTNKVKFLIATNRTMKIDGASAKDRVLEFEFSNYYSDKFSPQDEFKTWFFQGWDNTEWNCFFNFMAYCISCYLQYGLIVPDIINADRRRLLEHTNEDFVNWMDEMVSTGKIAPGNEYDKAELHNTFLNTYDEYKGGKTGVSVLRGFTPCIKYYIDHTTYFAPYKAAHERVSNGKRYIRFDSIKGEAQAPPGIDDLPF